jgi:hypothetical protein
MATSLSMREALNRLGRERFPAEWTGEEHKARRSLISADEWLKIKDLPPAHGAGEPYARQVAGPRDPSSPAYQAEYQASQRYISTRGRLHASLERGDLEAAILDPITGILHPVSASLWRQHGAAGAIERGQAPVPGSPNTGRLLVKRFAESDAPTKPMPRAKIQEAIEALKERTAVESLTRAQQKDFVRQTFPGLRVTERQFTEIFQEIDQCHRLQARHRQAGSRDRAKRFVRGGLGSFSPACRLA